jgi:Hsp70 protein
MGYGLGVDLGTTWTGAAVAKGGQVAAATLDTPQTLVPSLVHLGTDGAWSFGMAARRRAENEPGGLARAFKRSFGDPVPLVLSGQPVEIPALAGRLLAWVVDTVAGAEGERPDIAVLTHPAHWSAGQRELLRRAARQAVPDVEIGLLAEPEAVAVHYAIERAPSDGLFAVYDFGGGTFDATVLERTGAGFRIVGEPVGRSEAGGIDLDDLVVTWALDQLDADTVARLDRRDPVVARALRRLRDDAVTAKETLSTESEAVVPVSLPTTRVDLRLVRAEFEELARPLVAETVTALGEACTRAGVKPGDLQVVLLAGGSSRVPLVAELLAERLGVPVSAAVHPKLSVAMGAAATLLPAGATAPAATAPPPGGDGGNRADPAPVGPGPGPGPAAPRSSRSRAAMVAALVGVVVVVAAAVFAFRPDDGGGAAAPSSSTADSTAPPASTEPPVTASSLVRVEDDDRVAEAIGRYSGNESAVRNFVVQSLPRNTGQDVFFTPADCGPKLDGLIDNVDVGLDFAVLHEDIARYPAGSPEGYVDPAGSGRGFRERLDAYAQQVFTGYDACDQVEKLRPVATRVLGGWSALMGFFCATASDFMTGEPLTGEGDEPCPSTDEGETCRAVLAGRLEDFLGELEQPDPAATCDAAMRNDLAAFEEIEAQGP